jgi:hypothetical protein
MANAASLTNFSSSALSIGDWTYSLYARSAPAYLPSNGDGASYLTSSYPTLSALIAPGYKIFPVSTVGTVTTAFNSPPAYGGGVWVATSGTLANYKTSTDGLTWTARTGVTATVAGGYPVAYGAGVFVAVGNGTASSSPDGITWTTRASFPSSLYGTYVTWNGSIFVCVGVTTAGAAGTVSATSPDGITWTARTIVSGIYTGLAYGNGIWVATSGNAATGIYGTSATSPDGITWTARTTPNNYYDSGIAFGNGFFLLLIYNSPFYSVSTDGINWTTRNWNTGGGYIVANGLVFGDGVFVTPSNGAYLRYSTDAITWFFATTAVTPAASTLAASNSGSGNFFYSVSGATTPYRENLAISTTSFTLPAITPVTNTLTYIKAS